MDERFLALLDELRKQFGRPIVLFDAYRSWPTNELVGGKRGSMHPYGLAADPKTFLTIPFVKGLHLFSGIGFGRYTHRVTHVDARHLAGKHNLTGGTQAVPTMFVDGR